MNSRYFGILVPALLAWGSLAAQDMQALWQEGAFEVARKSIEALEPESRRDQVMAVWMTMVGREDLQADIGRAIAGEPLGDCVAATDTDIAEWADAKDWLLHQARDRRVVMFNENHYRTGARALVLELLPKLRELGFTHVGFEAFSVLEQATHDPANGFYTHEPLFAGLVRQAHALGFEIFGYETSESAPEGADMQEQIAFREQAQADNLMAAVDEAGEQARFVVFAGWSHIAKQPLPGDQRWMAARFMEQTGIDPLSVDLTTCSRPVTGRGGLSKARLPLAEDGSPIVVGHYAGAVDVQLHMPVPEAAAGSPGFFRQVLGPETRVPEALLPADEPVLVRARRIDRDADAVPDDQVMMSPGEHLPLYLPAGFDYEITAHRGDGSVIATRKIRVKVRDAGQTEP